MFQMTQADRIVGVIRAHWSHFGFWPTYGDILRTGVSTCPWKRLQEPAAQRALKKGERIERGTNSAGRVVFKIVRSRA